MILELGVTGNRYAHVAVSGALEKAIEGLREARLEGASEWRGADADRQSAPSGYAEVIRPEEHRSSAQPMSPGQAAPLVGSSFEALELPPPPVSPNPRPQRQARDPHKRTTLHTGIGNGVVVLVVDDTEAIRKLICKILEPLGVALVEASDGRRALELAREIQPDIVILDAMIPELHGFEVCRAIKGDPALRRARVLMVSAIYTGWKVGADVRANLGADGFLEKPFRVEELRRLVRDLLMPAINDEEASRFRTGALALCTQAAELARSGGSEAAMAVLLKAAQVDPFSAEPHLYLGQLLRSLQRPYEAVAALERAVELRPGSLPSPGGAGGRLRDRGLSSHRRGDLRAGAGRLPGAGSSRADPTAPRGAGSRLSRPASVPRPKPPPMERLPREFTLIDRFVRHFPGRGAGLSVGPGDDCALVRPTPGHELCVTTDTVREGVHFGRHFTPAEVGHKALAVNLSDLAAMGARPRWFLAALELPAHASARLVDGLGRGMAALAREHRCLLAGGNLCRGPGLAVTLTALGELPNGSAIRRHGLRAGDLLIVTGSLGLAALGLSSLRRAGRSRRAGAAERAQLMPQPRVAAGLAARGIATAGIDLSDGLAADLGHLCRASGCGAEIWSERLPRAAPVAARRDWLSLCLTGGEDYELLLGVAPEDWGRLSGRLQRAGTSGSVIGRASGRRGLWLASGPGGRPKRVWPRGFSHF